MAVSTGVAIASGLFIPLPMGERGSGSGLVGTYFLDAGTTGAAGGGTVTIILQMSREEFGFRILLIPTLIAIQDGLAAVGPVEVQYGAGNKRISVATRIVVTTVRVNARDIARVPPDGMVLEVDTVATSNVLSVIWPTNTDAINYHVHFFAAVYDVEYLEKYGAPDNLLTGVR